MERKMLSPEQMKTALRPVRLRKLSREIGVTPYHLGKMRDGDRFTPTALFKKVSDYFEGVSNED